MKCYTCKKEGLKKFLSLGHQPPSDAFLNTEKLNEMEATFPLDCYFCPSCSLVQLGYAVDPDILFRDYVYTTGSNNTLRENLRQLIEDIMERYQPKKGVLAVDIGSNDGTLLEYYLPHQLKVLGIDPSSSTSIAIKNGIPTMVEFFNESVARKAMEKFGTAPIITATNVFAHVVDLDSFMKGVTILLDEKGVFITESAYVVKMVNNMSFDQIYHEHLRYYGMKSLAALFDRYEMEIIHVEEIASHGGSIRVHAARKGAYHPDESVTTLINSERDQGFWEIGIYQEFSRKIVETKFELLSILFELKKKKQRIVGIGAPAKGNTLLNYCKLDPTMIDYLTEKSKLKIGLFSPGMHIPVVDEERLFNEQPEAALILSWNIADELVPKLRKLGYRGKFILPNPVPMIINK